MVALASAEQFDPVHQFPPLEHISSTSPQHHTNPSIDSESDPHTSGEIEFTNVALQSSHIESTFPHSPNTTITITPITSITPNTLHIPASLSGSGSEIDYSSLLHSHSSPPFPEPNETFLSRLFFLWVSPLISKGYHRSLDVSDLFQLPEYMKSENYVTKMQQAFQQYQHTSMPLLRCIYSVFSSYFLVPMLLLRFTMIALMVVRPFIVRYLLTSISNDSIELTDSFIWVGILTLVSCLYALANHHFWWLGVQVALSVRGALVGMLYRKTLTMHLSYKHQYNSGTISNLTSVDADNIMSFMWAQIHEFYAAPLVILLTTIGLVYLLGQAAFVGIGILILSLIINVRLAHIQSRLHESMMQTGDKRIGAIEEMLNAMKLIKLYAMEKLFATNIMQIRDEQKLLLLKASYVGALNRSLGLAIPLIISFATFTCFSYWNPNQLTTSTAFTALLLFSLLREPMSKAAEAISALIRVTVSQQRIVAFLNVPDVNNYRTIGDVKILNGTFYWQLPEQHQNNEENIADSAPYAAVYTDEPHDENDHHETSSASSTLPNSVSTGPVLRNINLSIPSGSLVMIVGEIGAGKSSLIHALLGELVQTDGSVSMPTKIAYTSQHAWLQSDTIRANILMGLPYDPIRYQQVVYSCALVPDFKRFSNGDMTVVGENGINMSGGQKQRLILARAAYSNADCYLFDEPLSAVDAHVAKFLYEHCLGPQGILAGKTRLLVTHQLQFANAGMDSIIVMKNGTITHMGTYQQLLLQGVDFTAIVHEQHAATTEAAASLNDGETLAELSDCAPVVPVEETVAATSTISASAAVTQASNESSVHVAITSTESNSTYQAETVASGQVNQKVYMEYFAGGAGTIGYGIVLLIVVASQVCSMLADYYLALWSSGTEQQNQQIHSNEHYQQKLYIAVDSHVHALAMFNTVVNATVNATISIVSNTGSVLLNTTLLNSTSEIISTVPVVPTVSTSSTFDAQMYYIYRYGILVGISSLLFLCRSIFLAYSSIESSQTVHNRLISGLMKAPQYFFECTPSGRILNRCSKDQEQIDSVLPGCIQDICSCGAIIIGTIGLIFIVVPAAILPIIGIALLYYRVQCYYLPSSRALKRLESVSRSPIYQYLVESHHGLATLRAYAYHGAVERAITVSDNRVDLNTCIFIYEFSVHRWLGVRLETIGALVVCVATAVALYWKEQLGIGLVALVITATIALSGNLNWMVRQISEMEVQFNSVDRILEYANVPAEEAIDDDGDGHISEQPIHSHRYQPVSPHDMDHGAVAGGEGDIVVDVSSSHPYVVVPPSWPEKGNIEINNLSVAYRPGGVPVLSNVNATIKAGERIGIVGRTGAGKSTMSLALFRLIPFLSGSITIDDINTSHIPLSTLRSRLSIIPQDSFLFEGSIRRNLDPIGACSDEQIWKILERLQLSEMIGKLAGGLDHIVTNNFSAGEMQLFCMARAALRGSKIVLLDEATAALDFHTDMLIRQFVQTQFQHCTVLTIAHRLNTILDSSRIMVFEAGRLVEFDTPANLMNKPNGLLAKLIHDTAAVTANMTKTK